MNRSHLIRLIPLFVMLLLSIGLAAGLFTGDHKPFEDSPLLGYDMAPFNVPTLGSDQPNFAPREWKGKVVVLNIFASWCKPCLAEHKIWMDLAKRGKVNLYGLAWKDTPENISRWLTTHGNPYQLIGVDQRGNATIPLALTGIPETFVIGPTGNIFYHRQDPVTQELVDNIIVPLVEKITSGELSALPRPTDKNPYGLPEQEPAGMPASTPADAQ